jgi:two-component system response regulator NreC
MADPIRVLISDDHAILRSGLKMLLNAEPDIQVIGEATTGEEALKLAGELQPDLVLMDISMPGMGGIEATAEIKKLYPPMKVLMLTMHENEAYLFRTIKAGGSGYVLKKAAEDELIEAIHTVHAGGAFVRPPVAQMLATEFMEQVEAGELLEQFEKLTSREKEVLALLARGMTNPQIADKLVISVRTVETHRAHIMDKLGFKDRASLVAYALRHGYLS